MDPDVITGYNIQNFDLPYLISRAQTLKVRKVRTSSWIFPHWGHPFPVYHGCHQALKRHPGLIGCFIVPDVTYLPLAGDKSVLPWTGGSWRIQLSTLVIITAIMARPCFRIHWQGLRGK